MCLFKENYSSYWHVSPCFYFWLRIYLSLSAVVLGVAEAFLEEVVVHDLVAEAFPEEVAV